MARPTYSRTRAALVRRLRPDAVSVSPKFHAILAYLLGQHWTTPAINGLAVTSDGFLLAQVGPDVGANHFLGTADDLRRNVAGVLEAVGATPAQCRYMMDLVTLVAGPRRVDGPESSPSGR